MFLGASVASCFVSLAVQRPAWVEEDKIRAESLRKRIIEARAKFDADATVERKERLEREIVVEQEEH